MLITKEKRNLICNGKAYRQKDHETPSGGNTYDNSIADDLELFYDDIKFGRRPLSMAWTYFSPELTLKEIELVENKDEEYMRSFKLLNNADVNEHEMKLSSSSSKYLSAYCRRKTIAIDNQNLPDANQESSSANKEKSTSLPRSPSGETKESLDIFWESTHTVNMSSQSTLQTEVESLIRQNKIARRKNLSYKEKLMFHCMILVLVIGGIIIIIISRIINTLDLTSTG